MIALPQLIALIVVALAAVLYFATRSPLATAAPNRVPQARAMAIMPMEGGEGALTGPSADAPQPAVELDPAQRKFCHGCASPLHVSAQICPRCGAPQLVASGDSVIAGGGGVVVDKQRFPHGLHIAITVLTGGVWLIPYLLIWGFRDKNRYL